MLFNLLFIVFFLKKVNSIIFLFIGKDKTILNSEVVQTPTKKIYHEHDIEFSFFFLENDMTV